MKIHSQIRIILGSSIIVGGLLLGASAFADTTTKTTTTHPDGTTTVEETTTTEASEPASQTHQPNLVGPTGATGVIRRSDRRQDRREGNPRIDR